MTQRLTSPTNEAIHPPITDTFDCYCGWKSCRSFQKTFRLTNHELLNGTIQVEFLREEKASHVVKNAWDRHLRVDRSRRDHWKKTGKCTYTVARHHFTEAMIAEYLSERGTWEWKIPIPEEKAKQLLWTLDEADSVKKKSSNEVGYLKVPNVPKDEVKKLVKQLGGSVDATSHSIDSFKVSTHSVDSLGGSLHSFDVMEHKSILTANFPPEIAPERLEPNLHPSSVKEMSQESTPAEIRKPTIEHDSMNDKFESSTLQEGNSSKHFESGQRDKMSIDALTSPSAKRISTPEITTEGDEISCEPLDIQLARLEVTKRGISELEENFQHGEKPQDIPAVETLQSSMIEPKAASQDSENSPREHLSVESTKSDAEIHKKSVDKARIQELELALELEKAKHENTKLKLDSMEKKIKDGSKIMETMLIVRKSMEEYQKSIATLNAKYQQAVEKRQSIMNPSIPVEVAGWEENKSESELSPNAKIGRLYALLQEALINMEQLEKENEEKTARIKELAATVKVLRQNESILFEKQRLQDQSEVVPKEGHSTSSNDGDSDTNVLPIPSTEDSPARKSPQDNFPIDANSESSTIIDSRTKDRNADQAALIQNVMAKKHKRWW